MPKPPRQRREKNSTGDLPRMRRKIENRARREATTAMTGMTTASAERPSRRPSSPPDASGDRMAVSLVTVTSVAAFRRGEVTAAEGEEELRPPRRPVR